jgi:hypothetical protein
MASVVSATPCAACEELAAEKRPKHGILLCIGCEKYFCSQHIVQHRQHLTDLLQNEVVNNRNILQEKISTLREKQWAPDIEAQLELINKWELDTIETIKQMADHAHKQLHSTIQERCNYLTKQLTILSGELNALSENGNYFEHDIEQLTNRFKKLKDEVEHYPVTLSTNEISTASISISSNIQEVNSSAPAAHPHLPLHFIDQLLESGTPEMSFNLSFIKPDRMLPFTDKLIGFFHSGSGFPVLNIRDGAWMSLSPIHGVTEIHWSDFLQQFLALEYSSRRNQPNRVILYDSNCRQLGEIWKKSTTWNYHCGGDFKTLTCFKQYVLLVLGGGEIEKWSANSPNWYDDRNSVVCWSRPISCQCYDKIECIRMNDIYYALVIGKNGSRQPAVPGEFYFELRNHGMSTLHCIKTDYYGSLSTTRFFSLPNESGWLLFSHTDDASFCYVLDNAARRYDQNLVLLSNVTDIIVQNNLILLRRKKQDITDDILEIYEWKT